MSTPSPSHWLAGERGGESSSVALTRSAISEPQPLPLTRSMAEDREEMKWIDAELNVFKEQYGALKERITREGEESSHADHVLEQSKAITLAVRHHVKTPTKTSDVCRRECSCAWFGRSGLLFSSTRQSLGSSTRHTRLGADDDRSGMEAGVQTRREQAKLLQETQQKIRNLKIGSYRDTPKAIAFRSPHGILPKEIRPVRHTT